MLRKFVRTNCWLKITDKFVDSVCKNYHYSEDQRDIFENVAWSVRGCIKDQEAAELLFMSDHVDVAFSLGARLDIVIENYSKAGKLLEALMATNLASALLMEGYKDFEDDAKDHLGSRGIKYLFWGSEELPIEDLAEEIDKFDSIQITAGEGMNLKPSQSVVYRMVPGCDEHSGLCATCERGLSGNCEMSTAKRTI